MVRRDEGIAERHEGARARAIGAIALGVIAKARAGDTTSKILYFQTRAAWHETPKVETRGEWDCTAVDAEACTDETLDRVLLMLGLQIEEERHVSGRLASATARTRAEFPGGTVGLSPLLAGAFAAEPAANRSFAIVRRRPFRTIAPLQPRSLRQRAGGTPNARANARLKAASEL